MQNDLELLRLMMGDQSRQSEIYQPGPYWQGYQKRTERAIERHGLLEFRARPDIGKGYADTQTKDPSDLWHDQISARYKIKRALLAAPILRTLFGEYRTLITKHRAVSQRFANLYYQNCFGDWFKTIAYQYDLPDSLHAGCQRYVTLNDENVAQIYVDFLMRIHNFGRHLEFSEVRVAFEIGGGFGTWPHLIFSMFPNVRKIVYLDIPPMIYVATQYLKHFFGDMVIDYRQTKDAKIISFHDDDSREILCLCPWQIEKLEVQADLFWNTASFSEMTPDIVGNYATHVARCLNNEDANICLLLNYERPHPTLKTTLPDEVTTAFGPGFEFQKIDTKVEHPTHALYSLGRRK